MSLIAYIVSSILLSWVGWGAYQAFAALKPGFAARRYMLWAVVALSLALPLITPFSSLTQPVAAAPQAPIAPIQTVHEFCNCANPGAGDVIRYQASRVNDVFLAYRPWIWGVFALILGAVLLRFAIRLARLMWLTRRYAAERIEVEGQGVRLVRGLPGIQAGALRLGGRYIFWHHALDALPPQDQKAILLHELSHIRQFNTYEKLLLGLVQAVWFVNPAYYWIARQLDLLSEYTADRFAATAMGSRKNYALLLLSIKTGHHYAAVNLFRGGTLKARIHHVLNPQPTGRLGAGWALPLGLALLLPSDLFAENIIQTQIREIAVYEFLTEANLQTGKEEFCKKCTYDAVDACK